MARTIFVAPVGRRVGKTTFCLGLIFSLKNIASRVAYMKPVGQRSCDYKIEYEDTHMIAETFGLEADAEDLCPINIRDLEKRLLANDANRILDDIAAAHEHVSKDRDVVIVEGADLTSVGAGQTDLNISVASRLNAQVLLLVSGDAGADIDEIVYETVHSRDEYVEAGCQVMGTVVNMAPADKLKEFKNDLKKAFKPHSIKVKGVIPAMPILGVPSMRDITAAITGSVVIEGDMHKLAHKVIVGAMRPTNMLGYLGDNMLIITPGDRDDMLLALAVADLSTAGPFSIAGIILTGNLMPDNLILDLVRKLDKRDFPVVLTKHDTFKTAAIVNEMDVHIRSDDIAKIQAAEMIVETYCDCRGLFTAAGASVKKTKRPQDYLDDIIRSAKKKTMHIVLSEGTDERVLRAAVHVQKRGIARVTLLGDEQIIREKAGKLNLQLQKIEILNPATAAIEAYAQRLHKLRKHRGVGIHTARDLVRDNIYYSAMMVEMGCADGYVAGASHSTSDVLRPALQVIGTAPDTKFVSSSFLMLAGPKAFLYGDCAIIENPDAEQLASIAVSSARTARNFGIKPVVAMLSYSTGSSGSGSSVDKVRKATSIVKKTDPDILIEGPIQYDAAFDAKVAKAKLPESKVAGRASVFIFPDLNSGNIAYKAVQREAGALAIGPVCQGFRKPVNDLSRGCTTDDIIYVIAITAIQAQKGRSGKKRVQPAT